MKISTLVITTAYGGVVVCDCFGNGDDCSGDLVVFTATDDRLAMLKMLTWVSVSYLIPLLTHQV